MECMSDGQIIRAKELDKSYTIPKKKPVEQKPDEPGQTSILNETYTGPMGLIPQVWPLDPGPDPYCNYLKYFEQGIGTTNNINGFNLLKRTQEEPKIPKPNNGQKRDTSVDVSDETLPKELREQFQPLFCKLCSAQLGSTVNAKIHYVSKNHNKKVKKYLEEYSVQTGEPLHKRARISPGKNKRDEDYDPKHYHCEACDLPLTGKMHAESHYMGKNHQKVISGKKAPGKGHYNDDGQFVRMAAPTVDLTGRDGFGLDFAPPQPNLGERATSLRCDLCQISVTSLPQMDMHLAGQKHQKKMKIGSPIVVIPEPLPKNMLYATYRTPSGQYYCKVCDQSLNSEMQFGSHLQSKNHAKKTAPKVDQH